MWFGRPLRNQPLANTDRKRHIDQTVPVDVTELTPPQPEFDAAEAMRMNGDAGPRRYFRGNPVADSGHRRYGCELPRGAIGCRISFSGIVSVSAMTFA